MANKNYKLVILITLIDFQLRVIIISIDLLDENYFAILLQKVARSIRTNELSTRSFDERDENE